VVSLKLSDIDGSRMVIRVEQGKGGKDRHAMLSDPLLALLRAWWRAGRERNVMLPGGWLFPGRDPVNPLTTRRLNRAFHAAKQAAGIDKPVSLHTLRHCFATHLPEQKVDIRVIQVLLGHNKLDTTAHYARVASTTLRAVTARLGSRLPRARSSPRNTRQRHRKVAAHPPRRRRAWPDPCRRTDPTTPNSKPANVKSP
jgi:site-specific recombinase XerD